MIAFLLSVKQPVRILSVVLYVLGIMALSLLPPQDLPKIPLFRGADKVIHFMMYFVFSILFCWALRTERHYSRLFFIVVLTIGWGVLMEFIQFSMRMGRSFSWYDISANSLGVLVGIVIYVLVARNSLR
ncbi:MAG: VanZ family protein [Prolixibacteraceae bacterium]|jgi:VanZ family protein|nr:VanZ family protein [Prolixibacteraceae bacterium]